ncbi:MAG: TraB/GumN family protein [Methanosphaera stadtmanae]|nr:TraB/GumN family protein [Methanosphaera stadtmanae]
MDEISNENKRVFLKPPIIKNNNNYPNVIIKNNSEVTNEEFINSDQDNIESEIIGPIREPSLEIVPTAHISDKSVETVRQVIYEKKPEIVAIELDIKRYNGLLDEARGIKREQKFDLKSMLKDSNLIVMLVSSFLSSMQRRMGAEVGVSPGSEMLEAAKIAQEVNADIALIDRDIQITLKRTINGMSFREKLSFGWEILKSYFISEDETEDLKEEIENLKEEDTIVEVMNFFKETSPGGYNALVHERDAYMAYNLKSLEDKNVVAVVGAGHKQGILEYLSDSDTIPPIESISSVKESRFSIIKILLYLIPILFILIFVLAFIQGANIQAGLINYLIFAGGGAFLGSLLSGSKLRSAVVGLLVAPVTVIHPLLAAGWFSGIVEGRARKVGWDDLHELSEFESFKDLWHNKLFRVILVVIGTNLGCTIGFLLTINNVFIPYIHQIFGF